MRSKTEIIDKMMETTFQHNHGVDIPKEQAIAIFAIAEVLIDIRDILDEMQENQEEELNMVYEEIREECAQELQNTEDKYVEP